MGWLANIVLLYGAWLVACKDRRGLALQCVGCSVWVWLAIAGGLYDLAFIETCFSVMNVIAWFKWGPKRD
jgi:hypothetical protein